MAALGWSHDLKNMVHVFYSKMPLELDRHLSINRNKNMSYRKTQNVLESENQEHKRQLESERWRAHAAAEKARDMIKVAN